MNTILIFELSTMYQCMIEQCIIHSINVSKMNAGITISKHNGHIQLVHGIPQFRNSKCKQGVRLRKATAYRRFFVLFKQVFS